MSCECAYINIFILISLKFSVKNENNLKFISTYLLNFIFNLPFQCRLKWKQVKIKIFGTNNKYVATIIKHSQSSWDFWSSKKIYNFKAKICLNAKDSLLLERTNLFSFNKKTFTLWWKSFCLYSIIILLLSIRS